MKLLLALLVMLSFCGVAYPQAAVIHVPADPVSPNCIDSRVIFSDATNRSFFGKNGACFPSTAGVPGTGTVTSVGNVGFTDGFTCTVSNPTTIATWSCVWNAHPVLTAATDITLPPLIGTFNFSGATVVWPASVTTTEFGYVHGVTSAIQTQLNAKGTVSSLSVPAGLGAVANPTTTPTLSFAAHMDLTSGVTDITLPPLVGTFNFSGATVTWPSLVTTTEFGYVHGVTSAIQTQLNNKAAATASTTVNQQPCPLGGGCALPLQTNGSGNTSNAGLNFITSTVNSVGLTVTPSNPGTNQEKFEVTGTSYTGNAATASALAANPTDCAAGTFANTIDANGNLSCVTLSGDNSKTGTYQVLAADFDNYRWITIPSGTFDVTLVDTSTQPANGKNIHIVNYGSGVITIKRSGQNINGGTASLTLPAASATAPTSAEIESDGTNYKATLSGTGGTATVSAASIASANYAVGGGTAQAQTAAPATPWGSLTDGAIIVWTPVAANTAAAPTLAVSGLTAKDIVKCDGDALLAGDILIGTAGFVAVAKYDSGADKFILINPAGVPCGGLEAVSPGDLEYLYYSATGGTGGIPAVKTTAALNIRAIAFSLGDFNAASALTTGGAGSVDYITVPFACTITAYNLQIDAADATFRVKFWRVNGGTAIPAVGNSINTSGLGVSSGTSNINNTTLTDFTSTAVAANDQIAMALSTQNTVKGVKGVLKCAQ